MNPNSGEGVPQAGFEQAPKPETKPDSGELKSDNALERTAPVEGGAARQQPSISSQAQALALPADQTQPTTDDPVTPVAIQPSNTTAKDGDIIEKVWIDKAKAIVAQTRDDPFVQKKEMSLAKADYIQKRFNKTIPVDDTAAK